MGEPMGQEAQSPAENERSIRITVSSAPSSPECVDADRRTAPIRQADGESEGQLDSLSQTMADEDWRRWIAENLMVGEPTNQIIDAMTSKGFSSDEAASELTSAQNSPYVIGAKLVQDQLEKCEWLLGAYRRNHRLRPEFGQIERKHRLSRGDLLHDHYSTNRAVVITGLIDSWPALRKWNPAYFAENFGDRQVEVRRQRFSNLTNSVDGHNQQMSITMFRDFVEQLCTNGEPGDFHLTAHSASGNRKVLAALWDDIEQIPEYLDPGRPDGTLSMMPRGAFTPCYHNLTNTLIAQATGRSRVKITPSWDIPLIFNDFHCFSRIDGRRMPTISRPAAEEPQIYEFVLEGGEVLFLPVGWFIFAEAIEVSVTVTFAKFVFDNDFASFYTTYGNL